MAKAILAWARANGLRLWWGKGSRDGSCFPMVDYKGETQWLIAMWTYGRIEIQFQTMKTKAPFADELLRRELLRQLNEIPGVILPEDSISRRPNIPLSVFADQSALQQLLGVLEWALAEMKR